MAKVMVRVRKLSKKALMFGMQAVMTNRPAAIWRKMVGSVDAQVASVCGWA